MELLLTVIILSPPTSALNEAPTDSQPTPMSTPKPRFFLGSKRGGGTTTTNAASSSSSRTPASSSRATPGGSKPPPPPPDAPILNPDGDRRLTEVSNPDDVCPVCRNDRYLNPKLRLMVSKCYHKMYSLVSLDLPSSPES